MIPTFEKAPGETLDYTIDWSAWLSGADTIAQAVVWAVPAGLTKVQQAQDTKRATVWISGGTVGQAYPVACLIETAEGRVANRFINIRCVERR